MSFEPIDVAFKKLEEKNAGDPLWHIHAFGLGARAGTATINVSGNNAESSCLPKMAPRLFEEAPSAAYVAEETSEVTTRSKEASANVCSSRFSQRIPSLKLPGGTSGKKWVGV